MVNSIGTQSELLSKQNIKLINIADSINKEIDNLNEQIKEARERSNLLNGILGIFFGLSSIIMGIITEDPLLITSGLTQSFSSLAIVIDPSLADEKWARDFSKYGIFALMGDGAEAVQTSVMIVMIGNNLINNIAKSLENLVSKEASSIASKVGTLIQILNDTSILLGMSNQCVELFKNDPQQNEWLMISGLGIMAFAFHALCKVPELRNLIGESNIILVETALNVGTGIAMQCLSAKNKTDNIDLNNIGNKSQIERIILSGIETLKCKSKIIKTLINAMGGVQEFAIRQLGMNTISNGFANAITSYEKFNMDNAKAEQVYNTTQIDILQQSIEVCRANFMQLIQESHATENTMALQMSNLFGTLSQFLQQQSADVATHRL